MLVVVSLLIVLLLVVLAVGDADVLIILSLLLEVLRGTPFWFLLMLTSHWCL